LRHLTQCLAFNRNNFAASFVIAGKKKIIVPKYFLNRALGEAKNFAFFFRFASFDADIFLMQK